LQPLVFPAHLRKVELQFLNIFFLSIVLIAEPFKLRGYILELVLSLCVLFVPLFQLCLLLCERLLLVAYLVVLLLLLFLELFGVKFEVLNVELKLLH
jgi:hypothetical protein